MNERQYTMPVEVETPAGRLPERLRSLPVWKQAIEALLPDVQGADEYVRLLLPEGVFDRWMVTYGAIPFRCVVMWAPVPGDGGPPRYIGRVDVKVRYATAAMVVDGRHKV